MVERCPDKTEVVGSIPTTRTGFLKPFIMKENEKNKVWWEPALIMFAKVSVWIAVPVICALFIGKYLDKRYGTDPWIFIGATIVGFIISMTAIAKISLDYIHTTADKKDILPNDQKENNGKSN